MNESGYLRPMLQPGQTLLHPASTFFISIVASFLQAHLPATPHCLFPTGDGSVRVILLKNIRHSSIKGLSKEEGTLYIMPERLLYIYLIDEDAQVNKKGVCA
jgi:hypothetical protein